MASDQLGQVKLDFTVAWSLSLKCITTIDEVRESILLADSTVEGYIIRMKCEEVAGQTILHSHTHVVLAVKIMQKTPEEVYVTSLLARAISEPQLLGGY